MINFLEYPQLKIAKLNVMEKFKVKKLVLEEQTALKRSQDDYQFQSNANFIILFT